MTNLSKTNPDTTRIMGRGNRKVTADRGGKMLKFLLLVGFFVLVMPAQAEAYIGPGAGFALLSSSLAIFIAFLVGMVVIFTWPIRYVIRVIRGLPPLARRWPKKPP